jgi:TonB family protein
VKKLLAIGLPSIYAMAVYVATRPPKPVYTLANRTVMTVTDKGGPPILHAPDPEYPPQALRDRVEGSVRLKVTVAADGTVTGAVPLSGPEPLRQAAVDTVRRWQFAASATETEVEVGFSLRTANRSIVPPQPLRCAAPVSTGKTRGSVRVVAMIAPDGRVEFVHPVLGPPELIPAALASVKQWTFRPMLRDGKPDHGTAVVDVVGQALPSANPDESACPATSPQPHAASPAASALRAACCRRADR